MMRPYSVLFLGTPDSPILSYLRGFTGPMEVDWTDLPIPGEQGESRTRGYDLYVSHNYRHIVPADHLAWCEKNKVLAVNCHISYLPWNRGASPNAFAWYDGTKHGVTIHRMVAAVDGGPIIAAREITFGERETLATSYARLQAEMFGLFRDKWLLIREGRHEEWQSRAFGSYHSKADTERIITPLLTDGWATPVSVLVDAGRKARHKGNA